MKTGNTPRDAARVHHDLRASMEPGHEDREYRLSVLSTWEAYTPQWSPVMKTGNTALLRHHRGRADRASMEPGHEDREYPHSRARSVRDTPSLNGARS